MKESMRSKLQQIGRRLEEIDAMLAAPDCADDMNRFRNLSRERAEIEPVVLKFREYETVEGDVETATEMLADPESADFAQEEIDAGKDK
ncbi:MAG: PCRF domain-containing protein, partial [Candidatus Aphodousia sp.]|nr:PCRF domain-containing protein [Candidatus Aphodousia sp.]